MFFNEKVKGLLPITSFFTLKRRMKFLLKSLPVADACIGQDGEVRFSNGIMQSSPN